MILAVLLFVWIGLGGFILSQILSAQRLSESSREFAQSSSMKPEFLPFARHDQNEYPSFVSMVVRALIFGPICLIISIGAVIVACVSAIFLPQYVVAKIVVHVTKTLCFAGGIRVRERGKRADVTTAPCIVANHTSLYDIVILLNEHCCFVSMAGVRAIPFVGKVAGALGCIFVSRTDTNSRTAAKEAIKTRFRDPTGKPQLVVFPEGSTTNGDYILQFRRGAFEANVPIQPLKIEYSDHLLPITVINMLHIGCITMSFPVREVTLHWLPVISPSNASPEELSQKARTAIATAPSAYGRPTLIESPEGVSFRDGILFDKLVLEYQSNKKRQHIE